MKTILVAIVALSFVAGAVVPASDFSIKTTVRMSIGHWDLHNRVI